MKSRLNIFCIFIFVAIVGSFVNFLHIDGEDGLRAFMRGYRAGSEAGLNRQNTKREFYVSIYKEDAQQFTDSLYNAKTNSWAPVQYEGLVVKDYKQPVSLWVNIFSGLFSVVFVAAFITQFNCFIHFIIAVNRAVIFHWANVSRLRWLGWSMVIAFFSRAILAYCWREEVIATIDFPGYVISTNGEMWDFFGLILGLGVLIMAEVFAMGLRLQEEQELTV